MSNYNYTGIGMGKITNGFDWNFFDKISVSSSTFNNTADVFIPFTTQGVMLLNLGTGVVEVSLNGNTVHMELNSANASAADPVSISLFSAVICSALSCLPSAYVSKRSSDRAICCR